MEKYCLYQEIGKGRFSQVYKGRERKTVEYVALKRIDKSLIQEVGYEIQILSRLKSPYVVAFHDWYATQNNVWVIMEFCTGGNLSTVIEKDSPNIPEESVRRFGLDLIAGLQYVHSMGIIHCHLEPRNILINEFGLLKLSGFRYARQISPDRLMKGNQEEDNASNPKPGFLSIESQKRFPNYTPPEFLIQNNKNRSPIPSFASDFWSLGCILVELKTGLPPFFSENKDNCLYNVVNETPISLRSESSEYTQTFSSSFTDLIRMLLAKDWCRRPSWEALLGHAFWGRDGVVSLKLQSETPVHTWPSPAAPMTRNDIEKEIKVATELEMGEDGSYNGNIHKADNDVEGHQTSESRHNNDGERNVLEEGLEKDMDSFMIDTLGEEGMMIPEIIVSSYDLKSRVEHFSTSTENKSLHRRHRISVNTEDAGLASRYLTSRLARDVKMDPVFEGLLLAQDDFIISPIVGNLLIDNDTTLEYNSEMLGFNCFTKEFISSMKDPQLEAFLKNMFRVFVSNDSSQESRLNILGFIYSLTSLSKISNILVNSSFMTVLIRMLWRSQSFSISFRCTVLMVVGALIRNSAYISPEVDTREGGLIDVLLQILQKGTNIRLRRKAMATLGEIIFYVITQDESELSRQGRRRWAELPDKVIEATVSSMEDKDSILKHCAIKSIENIFAQVSGKRPVGKFCTLEVSQIIVDLIVDPRISQSLKATASSALSKLMARVFLCHFFGRKSEDTKVDEGQNSSDMMISRNGLLSQLIGTEGACVALLDIVRSTETNNVLKTSVLNIFTMLLWEESHCRISESSESKGNQDCSYVELLQKFTSSVTTEDSERDFFNHLLYLVEHNSDDNLKAKVLLFLTLSFQIDPLLLVHACSRSKFLQCLEDILSVASIPEACDSDPDLSDIPAGYVYKCGVALFCRAIRDCRENLKSLLKALTKLSSLYQPDSKSKSKSTLDSVHLYTSSSLALVHFMNNSLFRSFILTPDMINDITSWLEIVTSSTGDLNALFINLDVNNVLFLLIESISQHIWPSFVHNSVGHEEAVHRLLSEILVLLEHSNVETRALTIRVLRTIAPKMNRPIIQTILQKVCSRSNQLLSDDTPIPCHMIHFFNECISMNKNDSYSIALDLGLALHSSTGGISFLVNCVNRLVHHRNAGELLDGEADEKEMSLLRTNDNSFHVGLLILRIFNSCANSTERSNSGRMVALEFLHLQTPSIIVSCLDFTVRMNLFETTAIYMDLLCAFLKFANQAQPGKGYHRGPMGSDFKINFMDMNKAFQLAIKCLLEPSIKIEATLADSYKRMQESSSCFLLLSSRAFGSDFWHSVFELEHPRHQQINSRNHLVFSQLLGGSDVGRPIKIRILKLVRDGLKGCSETERVVIDCILAKTPAVDCRALLDYINEIQKIEVDGGELQNVSGAILEHLKSRNISTF